MMLRGEKPLAVFSDGYDRFPEAVRRYLRLFDRHAAAGRLVKREYVVPDKSRPPLLGWHTIIYALPEEQWRIDAMIELRLQEGWTAEKESEKGRLLGYEDWQNAVWLSRLER
jgi:hypothetical protein